MKRMIVMSAMTTTLLGVVASGHVHATKSTPVGIKKQGLYTAYDTVTGYDQIYFRPLTSKTAYQLTTTEFDKLSPQWGQKGVRYYFYDRPDNVIVTCDGNLFYYLESDYAEGSQLMMGCADPSSGYTDVVEGYPLTGFTDEVGYVDDYSVATGTGLYYDYDGTDHEASPLVVYSGEEESILLHDSEAHLGSTNYDDGFVMYYDDSGTGDLQTGLESTNDDNIGWNGTIACPRCKDHHPSNPSGNDSDDSDSANGAGDSDDDSTNQSTDVDSTQSTTTSNENQNTNSSSANQSQSSQNANDVNVTVNVNVTNSNTSSSESSSDFSGTVSSESSTSETSESTDPVATATETATPSISESTDIGADPLVGDFNLQGSGACSLNPSISLSNQRPFLSLFLFSFIIAMRILHARKNSPHRIV